MPSTEAVSLSKVKSKLLRPSLTSHFRCTFQPPEGSTSFFKERGADYNASKELIELSCTDASLPGSSIATIDIDNDYHGVSEKHAYRRLYDDRADFTFYVDRDYKIIYFFENWISYIVGENNRNAQQRSNYSYRGYYPKQYRADALHITKFERDNYIGKGENLSQYYDRSITYKFVNAYPISINSMPVSYDSSQLLKCTVSFTYTRYVVLPEVGIPNDQPNTNNETSVPTQSNSVTLSNLSGPQVTRTLDPNRPTLAQLNE
jgi:hypothetical protein